MPLTHFLKVCKKKVLYILLVKKLVMQKKKVHNFTVIIEKDEDDYFVGYVPSIRGCHTQGRTLDELMKNIKEAIELCLDVEGKNIEPEKFVGVQNVEVSL